MKSILISSLLGLTVLNSSFTFTAGLPKSVTPEPIQEYKQISQLTQYKPLEFNLGVSSASTGLETIRQEEARKIEEKRKAEEEERIRKEVEAKKAQEAAQIATAARKVQTFSSTAKPAQPSAPIVPTSEVQSYAQSRVCAVFGCDQWNAFHFIILKESTWNYKAINPSSGAGGLCQALPFTKMSSAGSDYRENPNTQIEWCISYIAGRYKTPEGAKSFWVSNRWF
jgi:hypothetical protein